MPSDSALELVIVTPEGRRDALVCESVHLEMLPDAQGRGGGGVGIRRGHIPALIALAPGEVSAWQAGACLFRARSAGGFASVDQNVVTLLVDRIDTGV